MCLVINISVSSILLCCVGHTLAGMEAAYACFCGKAIRNPTSKPTTDCKMPCLGDGSQMCGGVFRLSVYDTKRLGEL